MTLIPLIDFVGIGEHPSNPMKTRKAEEGENGMVVLKSLIDLKQNDIVIDSLGLGNDVYLAYNGFIQENNIHDCVELVFSFSERREDKFANERIKFFQKYFMFDRTHIDSM